jgi:hypothetical protein
MEFKLWSLGYSNACDDLSYHSHEKDPLRAEPANARSQFLHVTISLTSILPDMVKPILFFIQMVCIVVLCSIFR